MESLFGVEILIRFANGCTGLEDLLQSDRQAEENFVKMLKQNRFALLWIPNIQNNPVKSFPLLSAALSEEITLYETLREQYYQLNQILLSAGIKNILFKSVGLVPNFPHTSDNLDMLIPGERLGEVKKILTDLNFIELNHISEQNKVLFRSFKPGQAGLAVHVHTDISWEGVSFLQLPEVWKRSRPAPEASWIIIPSPEDAFLITIAHAFYENREVRLSDYVKIKHCVRNYQLNWQYIKNVALKRGWLNGLYFACQVINHLGFQLEKQRLIPSSFLQRLKYEYETRCGWRLKVGKILRSPVELPHRMPLFINIWLWYSKIFCDLVLPAPVKFQKALKSTINALKRKVLGYKRLQPGYLVCICGVDGSGKTSNAEALVYKLRTSEIKAEYIWIRGSILKIIDILNGLFENFLAKFKKQTRQEIIKGRLNRRQSILKNRLQRIIYKTLIFVELSFRFNWLVRIPKWLGKVIVCDRYVYDAFVDLSMRFQDFGFINSRWAEWLEKVVPKPDQTFFLDVSSKVALSRKSDEKSIEAIQERVQIYRKLRDKRDFFIIDAEQDFEVSNNLIVQNAFRRYLPRFNKKFYKLVNPN